MSESEPTRRYLVQFVGEVEVYATSAENAEIEVLALVEADPSVLLPVAYEAPAAEAVRP